ncbi:MAG: TonB-dependent receptor [Bacteroidota bacterium]|nr:TonB-dependent receptor [Bacteroidota bacterium]
MVRPTASAFALSASVLLVQAQQTVDESADTLRSYQLPVVSVTTTRAELGKSPVPFAELARAELAQRYTAQDLPTLLNTLPSVFVWSQNGNQIGYSTLVMRGFDQRRIAVLINEVPQNDPEDHNVYWIDLPDLAASIGSIQVQRGAGVTNYGAAAIGGSINITTSNFLTERLVRISVGNGWQQFGAGGRTTFQPTIQRYALEVSSGLIEGKYAAYGRMARINSWGYRDQSWAELNSYFLSGARFDKGLTTQINIYGGPLADGLTYYGIPKGHIKDLTLRRKNYAWWQYDSTYRQIGFAIERRPNELENFSQPHYELLNDWRIADNLELKSVLFYYTGDGFFDFDGSWADARTLRLTREYGWDLPDTVYPRNAIIRAFVGNRHGGWIPRLLWRHAGGELLVGAEVRLHRSVHWGKVRYAELLPTNFDPEYKIYSYEGVRDIFSVFAREQYELRPHLLLNLEGQLVHHSYRIRNERAGNRPTQYLTRSGDTVRGTGTLFDVRYTFFNPRIGLLWRAGTGHEVFGMVGYTSREPRTRNLYAAEDSYFGARPLFEADTVGGVIRYDFSKPLIKPERMLDIELGWRYRSEHLAASVNAFWMEFFDELVKSGRVDIFGVPIDGNAPRTRHIGVEAEVLAELLQFPDWGSVAVGASATLSRNRIIEYSYYSGGKAFSLNGNPVADFPETLVSGYLRYQFGQLQTQLTIRHVGKFYSDSFGEKLAEYAAQDPTIADYRDNVVDPYTVADFDVRWRILNILGLQGIVLRLQVSNLFNALYAAGAEGRHFFPGGERLIFLGADLEL